MSSEKENVHFINQERLLEMCQNPLRKLNVREDIIESVSKGLVWTSLRGIDSHGVRLLPHYVACVKGGRLNPDPVLAFERTGASTGKLDADHTFGHAAGAEAMSHAINLADESGVGAVSVRNSSHCGALSNFGHLAAERDMIGMIFTHATSRVQTPGSNRAFFGNNPICLVAPMLGEDPFCFDAATTTITFNAVNAAASASEELAPGLVADSEGRDTTDPNQAQQLMPIGDYKGFGLSMLVDVLCAVLSGMPSGNKVSQMFKDPLSQKRYLGQFFCALRIDSFRPSDLFKRELKELADRVRAEPVKKESSGKILVPGDPEKITFRERSQSGVPIPPDVWAELIALQ